MSCRASRRRAPSRRPWGAARTLLWIGGAFAIGGIPSGRIVAKTDPARGIRPRPLKSGVTISGLSLWVKAGVWPFA